MSSSGSSSILCGLSSTQNFPWFYFGRDEGAVAAVCPTRVKSLRDLFPKVGNMSRPRQRVTRQLKKREVARRIEKGTNDR